MFIPAWLLVAALFFVPGFFDLVVGLAVMAVVATVFALFGGVVIAGVCLLIHLV